MRAEGMSITTIAQRLACTKTSVQNWLAAWRAEGFAGVAEGSHPGQARRLAPEAEEALNTLLGEGDRASGKISATTKTTPG